MIKSIGYVYIAATDPEQWRSFASEVLGMMPAHPRAGDDNIYLRIDERPFRFAIVPATEDRLLCCGFELADYQCLEQVCAALEAAGTPFQEGSQQELEQRQVARLIKLEDPSANLIELYVDATLDYEKFVSPQGIPAFETGFNGDAGFGHAVLPAARLEETRDFYVNLLGMGQSDYMHFKFSDQPEDPGMGLHFLHADNPRHHSLALFESDMPSGCVHLMLEVQSVDEVGYCLDRVLDRDIMVTSTLGRHTNDRMLSFYMMTPGGFPLEFGCEGLKMNWENYKPTRTSRPSLWGHKFAV